MQKKPSGDKGVVRLGSAFLTYLFKGGPDSQVFFGSLCHACGRDVQSSRHPSPDSGP